MESTVKKINDSMLSMDEVNHFRDLAKKFAKKSILPIFEAEYPDGNLDLLPGLLDIAFEIGIAASPDKSMTGSEYGIWGSTTDTIGLIPSITLLSTIAETCGGIAMCLNTQGVSANLLLQATRKLPFTPVRVAFCLMEGATLPYCGTIFSPELDQPAKVTTTAEIYNGEYILNGNKSFVYGIPNVDAYIVMARTDAKWGCFLVSKDADGLKVTDAGQRTGLRACVVDHIEFNNVRIPDEARIDDGDAVDYVLRALCLNWIGMTAIAAGIARGAIASAKEYASERYQGGTLIENHPAIKMLIADSEARAYAAESAVLSILTIYHNLPASLKTAAMTKLTGIELCARAVTDSMQCFGGYGYMEDFRIEKRLRDITVLKSASGSPNYLKQLIFDLGKEGKG